ncbi:MAG: alpha-N-arabinofuranosidase [Actinomycetia bacterium]|nr:alpha-N-arabinofuranosidase [Actinomycetes bacterium]
MANATLHLHTRHHVGEVDRRVFGGFLEHMGRAVYEGVYDPDSAHADEHGCRRDVLEALDRLGFTVMRYPGGNFVSNYHWTDGVGPTAERPTVRDLAWGSIEPNRFGTDEFLALAARMGWTPMLAVNLGTGSPEEAADWVEYCNAAAGTRYADRRVDNGRAGPWAVPLWCLGNEMDGPWQVGRVPVHDYGVKASQAAHMMRLVDPAIELVVSGSSTAESPTWMSWDRQALEAVGGLGHYLSTHRYVGNPDGDTRRYLTTGALIDRQIDEMDAVCRYAAGVRRSGRRPYIAFDEWNVWFRTMDAEGMKRGQPFPAHLVEEVYDHQDALVVAQFLNSFIRRADVVKVANLAQIVNVIAPLLTRGDDLLHQTIFHALAMFRHRQSGRSLRTAYDGTTVGGPFGDLPGVDASVIHDDDRAHFFLVNRLVDETLDVSIEVADRAVVAIESADLLHHDDPEATNTWESPDTVVHESTDQARVDGVGVRVELPPLGFVALTVALG